MALNKSGCLSEESIHLAVMQWVRLFPKISPYVLHFPNESKRTPRYGKLLKDMGMRKGVSDLFIALPRNGYIGAWVEIKSDTGKVSPEQIKFIEDMQNVGYYGAVTRGLDQTLEVMKWYIGL